MKIECDVARDLIPLYIEELTSEGSNEYLLKHIEGCKECKEVFEGLTKETIIKSDNNVLDIKDVPPNKLVRRIRNRILALAAVALLFGMIGSIFGTFSIKIYQTRKAAEQFLDNVSKGDFGQAFDYVSYFDYASNVAPVISYEDAKEIWVNRVKELKSKGIYIKSYSNLETWNDDMYPVGEVTLIIEENGTESEYKAGIHFANLNNKWKVEQIYLHSGDENILEKALSGNLIRDK